MKQYLVIPDEKNGGRNWEHVVLARTPLEACMELANFLEADIEFADSFPQPVAGFQYVATHNGGPVWSVNELPDTLPAHGVVPWRKCPVTYWRPLTQGAVEAMATTEPPPAEEALPQAA